MKRGTVLAAVITALGVLITLVNLRGGLALSFPLLLGLLLIVDGAIRFAMLRQDANQAESPGEH